MVEPEERRVGVARDALDCTGIDSRLRREVALARSRRWLAKLQRYLVEGDLTARRRQAIGHAVRAQLAIVRARERLIRQVGEQLALPGLPIPAGTKAAKPHQPDLLYSLEGDRVRRLLADRQTGAEA